MGHRLLPDRHGALTVELVDGLSNALGGVGSRKFWQPLGNQLAILSVSVLLERLCQDSRADIDDGKRPPDARVGVS
jgi:hypothetical protein